MTEISNLRILRLTYGISQKELSERTGLSQSYISQIENGVRIPSYRTMLRIAAALKEDVSKILPENVASF